MQCFMARSICRHSKPSLRWRESLVVVEVTVGLLSISAAVLMSGGMCCVYHSAMCVRAVS